MIAHGLNIPTIEDEPIIGKTVLVRVDFDVSFKSLHKIADDTRLRESLATILYLLKHRNKLILVSKLNRPEKRDKDHSMHLVAARLKHYLPLHKITVVDDFLDPKEKSIFEKQQPHEVLLLENIRFYKGEKENDQDFAKKLASLADVYVVDAFAMMHRKEASIVSVPKYLPSFAGLLLAKEVASIAKVLKHPEKPFIAIVGGAKIPDKLAFLSKLIQIADYLLIGGGIANTFLFAKEVEIGESLVDKTQVEQVKKLIALAKKEKTEIVLPTDFIGVKKGKKDERAEKADDISKDFEIYDIGPETWALFGNIISKAKTIVWNGPMGKIEEERFARGTDFVYYSIADNDQAYSLVGGGDTLAAISKEEYLDKITHISTGGGAMLEFIENGTLPGLQALKK